MRTSSPAGAGAFGGRRGFRPFLFGWRRWGFTLAMLLLALGQISCCRSPRWNVLLVTFDTTRADHLGCYGYARASTPNLDALAAEGFRFEQALAAAPITLPSHSTILTGQYPLVHGVRDNGVFRLAERQTTLAEILSAAGYQTAAAVGSFPLAARFGIDQGFSLYDDNFALAYQDYSGKQTVSKLGLYFDERRSSLVNSALFPWLAQNSDRPFFAWAHYFDPHQPYAPPPPYDQLFVDTPYDGEIAYADESFGRLLDHLRQLGVYDRTLIIMTADHGEGLGEHNEFTHSTLAYNATLHVPLLMKIPGREGGVVIEQRVGTVDLVPTVLGLLGIEAPKGEAPYTFQGRSLEGLIAARGAKVSGFPRDQYAETLSPRIAHDLGELRVLFARQLKYIHGPRPELYDLAADPFERHDLVAERPDLAATMEKGLAAFLAENAANEPQAVEEMDEETRRRLESLGYISSRAGERPTLSEVLRSDGEPPQDQVDDINELSAAKQMLYEQRFLVAMRVIEVLLARHPDNPPYLQLRASAQLGLGQIEEALSTLERIRRLNPSALPTELALMQVATYLQGQGETARALALVGAQQEAAPSAVGQWMLASLFAAEQREVEEKAALEKALALAPKFAPARVDLAVRRAQAGDFVGAQAEIERALADMPYYARGHFNFGAMLLEQNRPEEALDRFARAVELEPLYFQARYALIATASGLGRRAEAEAALTAFRALAPGSPEALAAAQLLAEKE